MSETTPTSVLTDPVEPATPVPAPTIEFYAVDRWHATTHLMGLYLPDAHLNPVLKALSASEHTGPFHILIRPGAFDAEDRPEFLVRPFTFVQV